MRINIIILFIIMLFATIGFLCCLEKVVFPYTTKDVLEKAELILPELKFTINKYWNKLYYKHFIAGQIEQESCASLRQCWNPKVENKTSREYGFGLSQITIAYDKLGNVRFNNYLEAKRKYKELTGWTWEDRFNLQYQLTFIVLEDKSLYNSVKNLFSDEINRMAGAFVSYNAGRGAVLQRRALCKNTEGCDFNLWFNGLDTVYLQYETKMLYNQKLYELRNRYPKNILKKSEKYKCIMM